MDFTTYRTSYGSHFGRSQQARNGIQIDHGTSTLTLCVLRAQTQDCHCNPGTLPLTQIRLLTLACLRYQLCFPFRDGFREPSGSFRNPGKTTTPNKLPESLPETFRNCGETEKRQTSLPVSFQKPSGNLWNSAKLKMRYLCQCIWFCLPK